PAATANALYGRTDAALVSASNPLPVEHARDLRVAHTTAPQPMPVIAFAAMPAADRGALDDALRSLPRTVIAPLQFSSIVRIGEPRVIAKREIQTVPAASLGLKLDPPIAVPLRLSVELPRVEIPEDLFGPP